MSDPQGDFNPATGPARVGSAAARRLDGAAGSSRYDGGPEEGTRGIHPAQPPILPAAADLRYDGGPEEGTRGPGLSTD